MDWEPAHPLMAAARALASASDGTEWSARRLVNPGRAPCYPRVVEQPGDQPPSDDGVLPGLAADGTDLTLVRWALDLTPIERLRAFEALMTDVVKMWNAANRA